MNISKISVYQVELPLKETYHLSGGRVWDSLDSIIVRIETDESIAGWGETCPWGSNYLPAFAAGARVGIEELGPHLLGLNPCRLGSINHVMDKELIGHPYIKTAIDMACWDILGKKCAMPIYELMGGLLTEDLLLAGSLLFHDKQGIRAAIQVHRQNGCFQFSIKATGDPAEDVRLIKSIGEEMKNGESLKVDANRGWKVHEAQRILDAVQDMDVYIEQPCATYQECRVLRKFTHLPLVMDEILDDVGLLIDAFHDGMTNVVNIKIGKVGGLTKARQMRDLCISLGIPVYIQDTGGSEIAMAAIAHLAHSTPPDMLMSVWDCTAVLDKTVARGAPRIERGHMQAPSTPGLGIEPIPEILGNPVAVIE